MRKREVDAFTEEDFSRAVGERPLDGQDLPRPALSPIDPPMSRRDRAMLALTKAFARTVANWLGKGGAFDAEMARLDRLTESERQAEIRVKLRQLADAEDARHAAR